jgi:hypothetical protein
MNIKVPSYLPHRHTLLRHKMDRIPLELSGEMTPPILFPHTHTSFSILQIFRCVHQLGEGSNENWWLPQTKVQKKTLYCSEVSLLHLGGDMFRSSQREGHDRE